MSLHYCPGGSIDPSGAKMVGNMTFRPDLTYEMSAGVSGTFKMILPASCNMGLSCDMVGKYLASASRDFTSVECVGTDPCTCTLVGTVLQKSGTYTVDGSKIVVRDVDPKGNVHDATYGFCAKDGKLSLRQLEDMVNQMPSGNPVLMGLSMGR
jgi:hypothetical protein